MPDDLRTLPPGLPEPEDDGAADHLPGAAVPDVSLPSTAGGTASLALAPGPLVVFAFPWAGRPGEALPAEGWDAIPGARGCTAEACGFGDADADLRALGVEVAGISVQSPERQAEIVARLGLPHPLLSDERGELATAMRLPTFAAGDRTLLRRLTMLLDGGTVRRVWYPVFPPDRHARRVAADLRG
ncbi:MAG TPA: peroxiredoxin [Miltoncostaeaceae bacterium]|nr:peroxiredoxin [Miltoncostaeaceae bacterium]